MNLFYHVVSRKKSFLIFLFLLAAITVGVVSSAFSVCTPTIADSLEKKDYIKWVDFDVPYAALKKALEEDISAHEEGEERNWIETLAYLGAKYGGDFSRYQSKDIDEFLNRRQTGETIEEITGKMKYYGYYFEAYSAVLGGLTGSFREQVPDPEDETQMVWKEQYGLIGYSPIAKYYPFEHYDDFGNQRTYGYTRPHLGHDLMAATGTPVIAVESGVVEALGWNQYGGWRIGIRSFDGKRYYYYAHLRKNRPYAENLEEGKVVKAGDVIGYVGRTGYSTTENVNNIEVSHLHFGLQLIFDESQKEGENEIWIDVYPLTMLLNTHQSEVVRSEETKECSRKYDIEVSK